MAKQGAMLRGLHLRERIQRARKPRLARQAQQVTKPAIPTVCAERNPNLTGYIVCYDLVPTEDNDYATVLDRPIEIALMEMDGVHIFGSVWFIRDNGRLTPKKLRNELRESLAKNDSLLVSRVRPMWTYGKNIKMALDLIDEMGQGA